MLCTNKRARGSTVPFARRCTEISSSATTFTPPRLEPACPRHVVVPVRIARSRLPMITASGGGKPLWASFPPSLCPPSPRPPSLRPQSLWLPNLRQQNLCPV